MPVHQKAIQKHTLNNYKNIIYLNGDIQYKPLLKNEKKKKGNMNMTTFLSVSEKKNKY